jgi:1-phosphatidylinositol-4-phosphate 5-kinase
MEHFIKGLANTESQISAIPPERYGDRFVRFISGVTKTKEAADREKAHEAARAENEPIITGINADASQQHLTDRVMEKAEWQAERSRQRGRSEDNVADREMRVVRSPSAERGEIGTTLPVVEEAGESSSVGGRSNRSASNENNLSPPAPPLKETHLGLPTRSRSRTRDENPGRPPPTPPKDSGTATSLNGRPPTPPKDDVFNHRHSGPPTPPKEKRGRSPERNKELPRTPLDLETAIRVG